MVQNLKQLRLEKNLSQNKLAEIIGVSQQSINKYENHNIEPDIEVPFDYQKSILTLEKEDDIQLNEALKYIKEKREGLKNPL